MSAIRRKAFRLGLVSALVTASGLLAADDSKVLFPGGVVQPAAPEHTGSTVNMVTLLLAVVLAVAGGWVMWRRRRGGTLRETHALAIHETRSLGNRQYLVVAAYEGRKFLLGVCPGRIDLLAPLNERGTGQSPPS